MPAGAPCSVAERIRRKMADAVDHANVHASQEVNRALQRARRQARKRQRLACADLAARSHLAASLPMPNESGRYGRAELGHAR